MPQLFKLIFFVVFLSLYNNLLYAQSQVAGFDYKWTEEYPTDEFGPMSITFDNTGIREIEHAPAPYVHPRIFFGPSEIPDLKNRMQNTASGQAVMKNIHAYTTLLHKGYNNYNQNAAYARDAFGNRYIDNSGKWSSHTYYYKLIAQDPTALDGTDIKRKSLMASVMTCEAYECLIKSGQTDPDTGLSYDDRAADLATAMAYWASLVIDDPTLNGNNYNLFGGESMALCYDLNYNNMTTAQQNIVREALAKIISDTPYYGGTLPPYVTTSNWVGLNTFQIINNMAIEHETGYNHNLTKLYMRSYRNFLTYGWYESGVPYEGMGKNYQFNAMLVAMAKRGYSLLGHPNVRAHGTQFLPNITQPFGHSFVATDVWGGSGSNAETGGYKFHSNDMVGLKWAFPNDEKIDFVWRNYIEKSASINSEGYVYQQIVPSSNGYHNNLVISAIYAQDYQTGNWEDQNEAAIPNQDFFGPERGLAIFRSGHSEDDLMMHYHCRMDLGGHTNGDRNNFALSSLGRIWVPYTYGKAYQETKYHSCILVNDLGIHVTQRDGVKARQPGTILDYQSNGDFSTVAGDATYAYSWEWEWGARPASNDHPFLSNNQGWTKVTETWNDFRSEQGPHSYFDIPFYDYPDWNQPGKLERIIKRPYNPMEKVYRTAALIKGDHPLVLIADDVQKDNSTNNYKSLIQLAMDLEMESYTSNSSSNCGDNHEMDVIIKETNGNRRMLVRILSNTGMVGEPYMETVPDPFDNINTQRLVIESNTVTADFKLLLYPYNPGDPMPETVWNEDKDELVLSFGTDSKLIKFPVIDGRTNILLDQNSDGDADNDGSVDFCDACPTDASNTCNDTNNDATPLVLGNPTTGAGSNDGFRSNLVINETDTYTNTSGESQIINIDNFNFQAGQLADPVTPFLVKVNGDNDFIVLSVGTTRTSSDYVVGENSFPFLNGGTSITLNPNETIAMGFLDANADGSGSGIGSVIPFDGGGTPDEIWYTGGGQGANSGSVAVGFPPTQGGGLYTTLKRNYHFNIEMTIGDTSNNTDICTNIEINITLDNYPGETSWVITNASGSTVASGNNYGNQTNGSTVTINECLNAGCYDFTISDTYGDGICCSYGNGSYTVSGGGATLASGGEFAFSETKNFCLENQSESTTIGNSSEIGGSNDGWKSNLVINETDIYTNISGASQTVIIDNFNFYAGKLADPVTPFVVKVHGDNDFTVLAVGTTRTSNEYVLGENSFNFSNGGTSITLNPNETIAMGFLDANADGSSSGIGSVIPFDGGGTPDEIWYSGGSLGVHAASVIVGLPPIQGSGVLTTLKRNYHFNIGISTIQNSGKTGSTLQEFSGILDASIYPNPIGENLDLFVDVQMPKRGNVQLAIFDTQGRLIFANTYDNLQEGESTITLDAKTIFDTKGIYFLKINNGEEQKVIRLMR